MRYTVIGALLAVGIFLPVVTWAIEFYQAKEGAVAYERASSASSIIYRFKPGEEFKVLGKEEGEWLKVRFSNYVLGYVQETAAISVFGQASSSEGTEGHRVPSKEQARDAERSGKQEALRGKGEPRPPGSTKAKLSTCEDGHWISSVSSDGEIVTLEDGSMWQVDAVDTIMTTLWLSTAEIIACNGRLVNTDNGETVSAFPLSRVSGKSINPSAPNTASLVESRIDGEFEGWEGETIFKLENGQIWQQASYAYTYHYAYRPKVIIYGTTGRHKMAVEGTSGTIYVKRLK